MAVCKLSLCLLFLFHKAQQRSIIQWDICIVIFSEMFQVEFVLRCGQQIEIVLFVGTTRFLHMWTSSWSCFRSFPVPAKWSRLMSLVSCNIVKLFICFVVCFSSSLFDQFRPVMSSRVHHLPHKLRLSCSAGYHRTLALAALLWALLSVPWPK